MPQKRQSRANTPPSTTPPEAATTPVKVPILPRRGRGRPRLNLPDAAPVLRALVAAVNDASPGATHAEMVAAFNKRQRAGSTYALATFRAWLAPDTSKLHRRFPYELLPRAATRFAEAFGIEVETAVLATREPEI